MIHTFKEDFYGEILSVVMVGYIRPERTFDSLGMSYLQTRTHIHKHDYIALFHLPFCLSK